MVVRFFCSFVLFIISFSLFSQKLIEVIPVLDSMVKVDQRWRKLKQHVQNGRVDSISLEEVNVFTKKSDLAHYYVVAGYFYEYGFLGYEEVGKKGSNNFWLLVQHQADHPEFQDTVLKAMKIEVVRGNADKVSYAYLLDRVLMLKDEPQIYGTQLRYNSTTNTYEAYQIENPKEVDVRRAKIGLGELEEYIGKMNERNPKK